MKTKPIKDLNPEIAGRILEVEGEQTTLQAFLDANNGDPDVFPLSDEQLDCIFELQPGESTYAGTLVEIKRIS